MQKIEKKLKILKEIKPDETFVVKTRILILNQVENNKLSNFFKFSFNFKIALSFFFVLFFILISGFIFWSKNAKFKNLAYNQLITEYNNLNINQYIESIKNNENINESIKLALNSIENSKFLIESKINKEFEEINKIKINDNYKTPEEINELLNKIIN